MDEISLQDPSLVLQEDRFSRLRMISWWDQEKIAKAKILVVGAGALGNEILKNLALLGFSRVVIVDLDRIEVTNLSRAVLYRSSDVGRIKAEAAASAFKTLNDAARVQWINANILHDVGLGVFEWADIIIAGLDNREARLFINRVAWKVNRPWIDGAIEGINGVVRVFLPQKAPCYECTLGEVDWQILQRRLSCNLLTRAEMESGKVPTTPTIASIIAGMQVQESIKLLHGLSTLSSSGFVFEGLNHSSYRVAYSESPECMSHYTLPEIVRLDRRSSSTTLCALWSEAVRRLGEDTVLEFSREIISGLHCATCGKDESVYMSVGSVSYEQGRCPDCGQMRQVRTAQSYTGTGADGEITISAAGLPSFDIFVARNQEREIGLLIEGDAPLVLGEAK